MMMLSMTLTVFNDWALLWISGRRCVVNFGHLMLLMGFFCFAYGSYGMSNFIIELNSASYSSNFAWSIDFIKFLDDTG